MPLAPALLALLLGGPAPDDPRARPVRFATFNASLNRDAPGALIRDLSTPDDAQARNVAEIIRRVAPDVILINEFDHDPEGKAAALFQDHYLSAARDGIPPITYAHRHVPEVNTGVPSGHDLDRDGAVATAPGSRGYGNDALGFGAFPGQYGMVLYSKFPISRGQVRDLRAFLWKDMPGALLPVQADGAPWYAPAALAAFRLSSKAHLDVPIRVGDRTIHVLASHPTPPAFDGPEGRNRRRNHDEIRLWADYLTGGDRADYLRPVGGPLPPGEAFVLMGDQNADPADGAGVPGAIGQLLGHPRIDAGLVPRGEGGAEASRLQGGANAGHRGPAEADTADFDDRQAGNLRVDYVLPSRGLRPVGGGVFWPKSGDPLARLVAMTPAAASSDHRLVYIDVEVGPPR